MTMIQDDYTTTLRQTQETWAGVTESLTDNLQRLFAQSGAPFGTVDPNAAIDQVFDFWEKTLGMQRDMVKQLAGVTLAFGETVRTQAASAGAPVRTPGGTV